jgi:hypothetical protein
VNAPGIADHGSNLTFCVERVFTLLQILYKPYTVRKLVKKAFDQCNNKCGVPFEKNEFLTFLVCYI